MYRNTPHGKPQWSRPVYPDMNPENILWKSFWAKRRKCRSMPTGIINWRFFWDYSGGNVYENMCHQVSFWYKVMNLQMPEGGHHDRRLIPLEGRPRSSGHDERFHGAAGGDCCSAGSPASATSHLGVSEDVLGTDGTIFKGAQIRYTPEKVNRPARRGAAWAHAHAADGAHAELPRLHPKRQRDELPVRTRLPRAIACRMAVESYRQKRTMRWDAQAEEIV